LFDPKQLLAKVLFGTCTQSLYWVDIFDKRIHTGSDLLIEVVIWSDALRRANVVDLS
jgi:hypothetical protein